MLRVGLTGGLGSGKSTVARMLARRGAHVIEADALGREMMRPGFAVYERIVERFGGAVVGEDGDLNRQALARIAFGEGRVEELNAIVHPAVIARQAEMMREIEEREAASGETGAVAVVESALLFETKFAGAGGWRGRFDRVVLVIAEEEVRVRRFVGRGGGDEAEARRRMGAQIPDAEKVGKADFVVRNDGSLEQLEGQVEEVWAALKAAGGD